MTVSTVSTETKPADVAPVTPDVPKQSNGVDAKPAEGAATNQESVDMVAAVKAASQKERDLGKLVDTMGASVSNVVDAIIECDTPGIVHPTKTVWEVLEYNNLRGFTFEVLGAKLKGWDQAGRDALLTLLVSKGFSLTDASRLVGTSKATATRTLQKARAAADKAAGKESTPKEPSTPVSRARKQQERIAKVAKETPEEFPTQDRYALAFDTLAALTELMRSLARDGHNVSKLVSGVQLLGQEDFSTSKPKRSGAEGTTSTGVTVTPATVAKSTTSK